MSEGTRSSRSAGPGTRTGAAARQDVDRAARKRIRRVHPATKKRRSFRHYFKALGPGVITGAADNDPAGIATYSIVGATTGYSLLWLMLITVPMLTVVEEMSARVGAVTKRGLARVLKDEYGKPVAFFAVFVLAMCNLATIAADMSGVAAGLELITGISWKLFVVPVTVVIGYFMVARSYRAVSRFLFLLTPVFLLYVVDAILARPDWTQVLTKTFVPSLSLSAPALTAAVGLLGTTISPYLIFWQATEEVEIHKSVSQLKEESFDVFVGMLLSNLVFYFIIIAAGAVIFPQHIPIQTARDAALALKPLAGNLAFALFSIGLIGSGLIAVPVLAASTAYAAAEVFERPAGLSKDIHHARFFYAVIPGSLAFATVALLANLDPIAMLYYSQVLDGILMPVLIYLLIRVTNDPRLMGKHTNGPIARSIGWFTMLVMAAFAITMLYQVLVS